MRTHSADKSAEFFLGSFPGWLPGSFFFSAARLADRPSMSRKEFDPAKLGTILYTGSVLSPILLTTPSPFQPVFLRVIHFPTFHSKTYRFTQIDSELHFFAERKVGKLDDI